MFNDISQLLSNPVMFRALLKLFGGYALFMAFAGSLPMPPSERGGFQREFYRFFFSFVNSLSINIRRAAIALKVPGAVEEPKPPTP